MKRPLVVITAGFVLGEVLALCLQEAVYRIFFWFAGVLFLTVLAVRRFLSRSVMYRTLLLIFVFVFGGMTAGSFSGARCREQMEQEEKRIIQAGFGDVVQLTGQVVDVREKSEKLEIIVNQVKVGKRVRNHREVSYYASRLCITPKYLTEVCKKASGFTANYWIDRFTISRITHLLSDKNLTLKEISDNMNFSSLSFFSRYVQRLLKVSPSEYRNGNLIA